MILGSSRSLPAHHGCGIRRVQELGSGPLAARISKGYRPVRFDGPGIVVTIQENTDQPQWWDQILPDRRTMTLPCDHLGVLKPPYVQQTAALINTVLTTTRTPSPQ